MGKNQSASGLTNIIQYDNRGNISFVSGSTTLMQVSSSGAITTTGVISGSSAQSASLAQNSNLLQGTGSVGFATTASFTTASGSISTRVTQIEQVYATTGSNSFRATQSITGSLTVTGQIVAQTLNVQQVTSSIVFSSGSNTFGCDLNSRQTFTGSVIMTGSLTVNTTGTELQVNNNGVILGNLLTDNHNITGSLRVTGSVAVFNSCVAVGISSPTSILHISASSSTITGKVIMHSPSSDSGILQLGSHYGEASMMFIPGVTSFGTSGAPVVRTSCYGNVGLWGIGAGTYTSDPTKFGIANVGFGTNVLTVSSSGAFGIGTTCPTSRLFVLGAGSYNTTTSEILTSDATIFSSEMSNDAYNSILQLVSVRQSLSTGASSNGFLGFSTIDDSNGEGIRDAGRIAIVNETAASRNSPTALGFWTNPGGTKTTAATEKMRITSTGTVGIGTNSPTEILHLNNASTNAAFIRFQNTGGAGVYIGGRSDNMELYAGGSERARITSGGLLQLSSTNSTGIRFAGGSSNLNYYEEGSWTPALQNATVSYSERSGTYVRIGNYVFVRWGFRISTISGTSGTVTISGLPFTAVNWGSYQEPNISVSTGVLATADNAQRARVYKGGGDTSMYGRIANNADTSWATSDLQNGSWIIGEIFYNV
jgi:hypothetical protein